LTDPLLLVKRLGKSLDPTSILEILTLFRSAVLKIDDQNSDKATEKHKFQLKAAISSKGVGDHRLF
jgi:hypothetical protein